MPSDYTYIGKKVDDTYEYQYTLKTRAVGNVNATNTSDFVIQPLRLSIIRRRLVPPRALKQAASAQGAAGQQQQQSYEDYEQQRLLQAKLGLPSSSVLVRSGTSEKI